MNNFLQKYKIWVLVIISAVIGATAYWSFFGAPERKAESEYFIVNLKSDNTAVIRNLKSQGFIKHAKAMEFVFDFLSEGQIQAGGYKISKAMSVWKIAAVFSKEPYMKWVAIPEGYRKEQIADILAKKLSWSEEEKQKWISDYTAMKFDYFEGVYFPDTYLIPKDELPLDVAARLQAKFQEKFAPFAEEALKQNIKWDTALKLASLVQREAGKTDIPLIAAILWNRLDIGMKLDVDATIQYAKGGAGDWWPVLSSADKKIDSPYNTYLHAGLPPHPICNPGLDAIAAVLAPVKTDCLYYLHDGSGQIHCAKSYAEHLKNIEKYLR